MGTTALQENGTKEVGYSTSTAIESGNELGFNVIRRNNSVTPFDSTKITMALTKAFLAVEGSSAAGSRRVHEIIEQMTNQVVSALTRRNEGSRIFHIEDIQDQVELALMRGEHHKVARAYVLYREERAKKRAASTKSPKSKTIRPINVRQENGELFPFDEERFSKVIQEACDGLNSISPELILTEARRNLYDGMSLDEVWIAPILAARTLIETEPDYTLVSARLLLDKLRHEALSLLAGRHEQATYAQMIDRYPSYFSQFIDMGIKENLVDPELKRFDLQYIGDHLKPERDLKFHFLGLQTLYDRYLLHSKGVRFELPQAFFMRVAMGLAHREINREEKAIEFYDLLSSFDFMASTPTLFNSGTPRPQLSSCFLTTISDDLDGIFKAIKDNALLAKYSGGLGNDWTQVRGLGSRIKGTNGESQGVVPFLKVANDTAIAVNQGGKRKGAVCAYLETWHIDIEEFLELRKNTGDDRRRTHDMNTANWIPDLFMERVEANAEWTLFSPNEVPNLHDLYGEKFKKAYEVWEEKAERGEIAFRKLRAVDLWRKILTMLFETGHPWITFKDPCNIRSPQQHVGVIHSSNLCTEITLNTSHDEVAVCNLGSINLANHIKDKGLDQEKLSRTIRTAIRMLDNVVDINFYTIKEARSSNLRHRPIGLGLMGFQDALYALGLPYASEAAVEFADKSMEMISWHAISASCDLASEKGSYETFEGSLWSKGILPIDSIELLAKTRQNLEMDQNHTMDWDSLRKKVQKTGIRNSNIMAIAPTATISNICGVSQSIEPTYQNLFVKSNMSGDFTIVNAALVRDLKKKNLWDKVMISDLKYFDGSIGEITRIPEKLKILYATAFEIDPVWFLEAASRRQKWIDQAQSLNLYITNPSGKKLDEIYRLAWKKGLKTTYYLRSTGATHVEKSTLQGTDGKLNAVSAIMSGSSTASIMPQLDSWSGICMINDPECEACQ